MTRKHKSFGFAWLDLVRTLLGITHTRTAELRAAEQDAKDALDALNLAEARKKLIEAQTIAAVARAKQIPEQTEGITRRYIQTTENTENAILRQRKQALEARKLQLQIKQLEREVGELTGNLGFEPVDYP